MHYIMYGRQLTFMWMKLAPFTTLGIDKPIIVFPVPGYP